MDALNATISYLRWCWSVEEELIVLCTFSARSFPFEAASFDGSNGTTFLLTFLSKLFKCSLIFKNSSHLISNVPRKYTNMNMNSTDSDLRCFALIWFL
jgi:hypothetical protein